MTECRHYQYVPEWRFNNADPVYTCGNCNIILGTVGEYDNPVAWMQAHTDEIENEEG